MCLPVFDSRVGREVLVFLVIFGEEVPHMQQGGLPPCSLFASGWACNDKTITAKLGFTIDASESQCLWCV